jgi:hypothetical protein
MSDEGKKMNDSTAAIYLYGFLALGIFIGALVIYIVVHGRGVEAHISKSNSNISASVKVDGANQPSEKRIDEAQIAKSKRKTTKKQPHIDVARDENTKTE